MAVVLPSKAVVVVTEATTKQTSKSFAELTVKLTVTDSALQELMAGGFGVFAPEVLAFWLLKYGTKEADALATTCQASAIIAEREVQHIVAVDEHGKTCAVTVVPVA